MGTAERRNPRTVVGSAGDDELRALMILRDTVSRMTRLDFERELLRAPAEARAEIRRLLQSAGPWTIENRRHARIAREQERAAMRVRAITNAVDGPYGYI